eukprot:COSAG02_NODE_668_length_18685_cov_185.638976_5_plen_157_part_00
MARLSPPGERGGRATLIPATPDGDGVRYGPGTPLVESSNNADLRHQISHRKSGHYTAVNPNRKIAFSKHSRFTPPAVWYNAHMCMYLFFYCHCRVVLVALELGGLPLAELLMLRIGFCADQVLRPAGLEVKRATRSKAEYGLCKLFSLPSSTSHTS